MKITFLTIFPEMISQALSYSIPSRAVKSGLVSIKSVNLRDFGVDRHGNVDDTPYGGGPGMILRVDVAAAALGAVDPEHNAYRIMLSPDGVRFSQKQAQDYVSEGKDIVLLCGRYEGFDARIERYIDQKLSVGPYVVSGGELPSLIVADAIIRLIPGVLGNSESLSHETYNDDVTDYPQYTRPDIFQGYNVPEVLKSGHHKDIDEFRRRSQHRIG